MGQPLKYFAIIRIMLTCYIKIFSDNRNTGNGDYSIRVFGDHWNNGDCSYDVNMELTFYYKNPESH